ncbi:MAG: hypothetical protein ACJAUP_000646 [Cellvibrionaceae bacterium]|jgi:hypothetical protein
MALAATNKRSVSVTLSAPASIRVVLINNKQRCSNIFYRHLITADNTR